MATLISLHLQLNAASLGCQAHPLHAAARCVGHSLPVIGVACHSGFSLQVTLYIQSTRLLPVPPPASGALHVPDLRHLDPCALHSSQSRPIKLAESPRDSTASGLRYRVLTVPGSPLSLTTAPAQLAPCRHPPRSIPVFQVCRVAFRPSLGPGGLTPPAGLLPGALYRHLPALLQVCVSPPRPGDSSSDLCLPSPVQGGSRVGAGGAVMRGGGGVAVYEQLSGLWGLGKLGLSPAVAGMAATEGNVLHLEEVTAVLDLEHRWQAVLVRGGVWGCLCTPARHPSVRPPATPASGPYTPTSGPPLRLSLTPRREISRSQEAGGRRWTVSFRAVAIWGRG